MLRWLMALMLVGVLLGAMAWSLQAPPKLEAHASLGALTDSSVTTQFARVFEARAFVFPADHGPHDEYQTEWWYYTGNLTHANGRHFGYQLTLFRRAIAAKPADAMSRWTTNQIYIGHFALTDTATDTHLAFERLARGGAGVAGASGSPYKVWVEDWRIDSLDEIGNQVRVRASDGAYAIDLTLNAEKPIVQHGNNGVSQKSEQAGNASYYYSITRNATTGRVSTPEGVFEVTGNSWLDREWSTSALGNSVSGWDWFSIQLDDGRDLMLYKLRRADGRDESVSAGTLVEANGAVRKIEFGAFDARPQTTRWVAPSGARYPLHWNIDIPSAALSLELAPRINNQEMKVGLATYWEGAITLRGTSNGKPVTGTGYLELTGYRETMKGRL